MKKLVVILFVLGSIFATNAQFLNAGVKSGLNYNSNGDFENDIQSINISSDSGLGFHVGVFAEVDLPLSLYLRPELLYTKTQSSYDHNGISSNLSIHKIDVPILLGLEIFEKGRIFMGPSFQYILDNDLSDSGFFDEVKEIDSKDFSLGAQFGIGIEFGKLGFDLRWERSLTDTEAKYVGYLNDDLLDNADAANIDTRTQQFILGVYYKFK